MAAWVAVLNCGLKENLLDIHIFRNTGNTGVPKDAFTKVLKTQLINNSWRRKRLLTELVTKGALFSYLPFKNWTGISMDWNNNGLKQWFVRLDNFFASFYIIFICVFVWLCNVCEHMHGGVLKRGVGSPWTRVRGYCKPSDVGSGNKAHSFASFKQTNKKKLNLLLKY